MQAQHAAFVEKLRAEGVEVHFMDGDAGIRLKQCYTRDPFIMVKGGAIVCRMGARIRRGEELAALDDAGFRDRFAGSPIMRIGRDRLVRNVLYALGTSGLPGLPAVADRLADDPVPAFVDATPSADARLSLPA